MKTRHLLAATLVACSLGSQAQVIQSYQVRDAVTLRTPIFTDSINTEGIRFLRYGLSRIGRRNKGIQCG